MARGNLSEVHAALFTTGHFYSVPFTPDGLNLSCTVFVTFSTTRLSLSSLRLGWLTSHDCCRHLVLCLRSLSYSSYLLIHNTIVCCCCFSLKKRMFLRNFKQYGVSRSLML